MKFNRTYVIVAIVAVFAILAISNPSKKQHEKKAMEAISGISNDDIQEMKDAMKSSGMDSYANFMEETQKSTESLTSSLIDRQNLIFFSLTKAKASPFSKKQKTIGVGILGMVFIFETDTEKFDKTDDTSSLERDKNDFGNVSDKATSELTGQEWLEQIFRPKSTLKFILPNEEAVCTERYLRLQQDAFNTEYDGPDYMSPEDFIKKWGPIYGIDKSNDNHSFIFFGRGNGDTENLKNVVVRRISIMKYEVWIDYGSGDYKTLNEVTLVSDKDGYKIDLVKTISFYE